jgi:hypothetical protein
LAEKPAKNGGVSRVRRFFGKPKKKRCFFKTKILDVTFGEKPKNRGKTGKNKEKSVFH